MRFREFNILHKGMFRRVFVLFFMLFNLTFFLLSQPKNNAQMQQTLIQEYLKQSPFCFKPIKNQGETFNPRCSDTLHTLSISAPDIQYQKTARHSYLRTLTQPLEIQTPDTLMREALVFQDSLTATELRQVRKSSPKPMKGENPFPTARYIRPALWASGTFLLALGLFYWRG